MEDLNGLELSPQSKSNNAYLYTTFIARRKKYSAYARMDYKRKGEWQMYEIGTFEDSRDAAFIAQMFAKHYTREAVREMVEDGSFPIVTNQFVCEMSIPEWKHPAAGLDIEDIIGGSRYELNFVCDAKEALRECIKVFKLPVPPLKKLPDLVAKVNTLYEYEGMTYRNAAKKALGVEDGCN